MLLREPINALCSHTLEDNYRGRLSLYFKKEFNLNTVIPESCGTYFKEYSLERIDYDDGTFILGSWYEGQLQLPVVDFTKLRKIQEVANDIVAKLNAQHASRKEEKEAKYKEERFKQFLALSAEFGNE